MTLEQTEVAIVGGGPAGIAAAIEAARAGAQVTVLDENPQPGGQIYRQLPPEFSIDDRKIVPREHLRGQALVAELGRHPIRFEGGAIVWGAFEPNVLEVASAARTWRLQARAVIVATGAYDRPVPVPGWTLPGVITVGGAQTLLKAQRILPGRRILMAGTGPLLLVVAAQLAKAGAGIVAVVDPVPILALIRQMPALLRAWSLLRDGLAYRWTVRRAGVPWIAPSVITRIEGDGQVERAVIARADADWRPVDGTERAFDVDTVCLGYGLVPSVELLRLMGCDLHYDDRADAWVPRRSRTFETSVPGVFAVGDGAGVAGVKVALEEGRVAGAAAARIVRKLTDARADSIMAGPRRRLAGLQAFREAIDSVYWPRPGLRDLATPDTIVCRCEEIRRADIERAVRDGAASPTQVKAWTRAGMGACQARMCAGPTAHLISGALGRPVGEIGAYTARPPLKPVPVSALVGEFKGVDAGSMAGQGVTHPQRKGGSFTATTP
jgi:thioredoxin reductase/bacterioferritin-associated ferredoxin